MNDIALIQDKEGKFSVRYKDGDFVMESSEISFAKHNLLCFGRLNRNLTINPKLRKGDLGSFLENNELFSTAWLYYMESNITLEGMRKLIGEFNRACERDFKLGLFENRILLKNITKLSKNSLLFKIQIGNQTQDFTINI